MITKLTITMTTESGRIVEMSIEAARNVEATGADIDADIAAIRSGEHTAESLLAHCLDGDEDMYAAGWEEYVDAVVAAAADA